MSESVKEDSETAADGTLTEDPRHSKSQAVLKAFGLGVGLVGVLFLGGAGIAWFIQGPLFYDSKTIQLEATVVGNAVGALGIDSSLVAQEDAKATFVDKRHWLVLSYPGCEDALQGFWIPDQARAGAKQSGLLNDLRACFLPFKPGAKAKVEVLARRNRSSDARTWRVESVGTCDARQIETILNPKEGAKKCDWM